MRGEKRRASKLRETGVSRGRSTDEENAETADEKR